MKNTMDKNEVYARIAFNNIRANIYLWDADLTIDIERALSRSGFYHLVFDTGPDRTGLSTLSLGHVPLNQYKYRNLTDDHFMAPQTCGKFLFDTPEYLRDFKKFFEFFKICRKTILVTKDENEALKQLTKKKNVLTKDRYHHLGYKLYNNGEILPEGNQVLDVPNDYTIWEEKFIANTFRPVVVPSMPKLQNLDKFFL